VAHAVATGRPGSATAVSDGSDWWDARGRADTLGGSALIDWVWEDDPPPAAWPASGGQGPGRGTDRTWRTADSAPPPRRPPTIVYIDPPVRLETAKPCGRRRRRRRRRGGLSAADTPRWRCAVVGINFDVRMRQRGGPKCLYWFDLSSATWSSPLLWGAV